MEKQFYNFVKEVYDKQLGVEGIAIADGEKILMEHHFTPDQARNIYSHTKSYMSTAVGLQLPMVSCHWMTDWQSFSRRRFRKMHSRSCLKFVCVIFL